MNGIKKLCNYFFYCGIEKEEYRAVKKDAYVSNFVIWRILHFLMAAVFLALFAVSLFSEMLKYNAFFYFIAFLYSIIAVSFFFSLRKDSLIAQLIIYLSISMLFLFACLISKNNPSVPATTFIVFLLITPMFMIDKPFFMAIELCAASGVFLVWMHNVKVYEVWMIDFVNVLTFTLIGIFLNIIANAVRIREFILTREINIQKDTDEMTGLKNKGALTRNIDKFLADPSTDKGIMFMLDIDRFKSINDTYGHDIGDSVIGQLGNVLAAKCTDDEILGRFGGDEFILFIKNTDDIEGACELAADIIQDASEKVALPSPVEKISISIGIAVYKGLEKSYSEIFKKADIAMYKAKADSARRFYIYE